MSFLSLRPVGVLSAAAVCLLQLALALGSQPSLAQSAPAAGKAQITQDYGKLPISFEANQGQTDKRVKFLARGQGYGLFLTGQEAVLTLHAPQSAKAGQGSAPHGPAQLPPAGSTDVVRMQLRGANATAQPTGVDALPGTANYFIGNDPSKWHANVPTFSKVRFSAVYPGVDLVYYGNQSQLEYDFVVAPGADPKAIRLHFAGASKLALTKDGDLSVAASNGQIAFHKPVVYQVKDGQRHRVEGRFTLLASHNVSFSLGSYDRSQPLVIDPVLVYSTYLGGSGACPAGYSCSEDPIYGMAVDASGNAYVAGGIESIPVEFGVTGGISPAFVAKLNSTGTALIYFTYVGQSSSASGVAVDANGNAYITGLTFPTGFPVTNGAFQTSSQEGSGNTAGFVTELNPTGSALVYSTFLGGSGSESYGGDQPSAIALDGSGNAYVTGMTYSANFPVTAGAFQATDPSNSGSVHGATGFVAKLNPLGTSLAYSTYLGGSGNGGSVNDQPTAIAVDSTGRAYVAGATFSSNFPVTSGAFQTTLSGNAGHAFVTEVNPTGTALVYSTFLGGSYQDQANAIAVDGAGSAYVTGFTTSPNFPATAGAFQSTVFTSGGSKGVFVTKLNPAGTGLVYSALMGGFGVLNPGSPYVPGDSVASALAVDGSGSAYVAGETASPSFPVTAGAFQSNSGGAFVTEINPTGAALAYSAVFGSGGANGIGMDQSGKVYVAGDAGTNFPVTPEAFQSSDSNAINSLNGFVAKLDLSTFNTSAASFASLTANNNPQGAGQEASFSVSVAGTFSSVVPTGSVTFNVDGLPAATSALDGTGSASYSTSSLSLGVHTVQAVYNGDSKFTSSTSNTVSESIYGIPTITWATPAPITQGTALSSTQLNPTASVPGTFVYSPAAGTVLGAGTQTLSAIFTPTDTGSWVGGSASVTLEVNAPGTINTFAGNGSSTYNGDNIAATAASVSFPQGVAIDASGNVYIAESDNRVRKVDTSGNITTIAGTGVDATSGDGGLATAASVNAPSDVKVDRDGNVYICETGGLRVRKINSAGIISTVAGGGSGSDYSGEGGPATSASIQPLAIALDDSGNLYIADYSHRVLEVTPGGTISTVAGNGTYQQEANSSNIGDGGPATQASVFLPRGLATDTNGNLYIADYEYARVRKVTPAGIISTIAGGGTNAYLSGAAATSVALNNPWGVTTDSEGNVYMTDAGSASSVYEITWAGTISTIAGGGSAGYGGDGGPATAALLNSPTGLAFDLAGNLYIADELNNRIREVSGVGAVGPVITSVSAITPQQTQTITITGSGFGTNPPFSGTSDYLGIWDVTAGNWSAGYGEDAVTVAVNSWTDTQIVLTGFGGFYGSGYRFANGDSLTLNIWSPTINRAGDVNPTQGNSPSSCLNIIVGGGTTNCSLSSAPKPFGHLDSAVDSVTGSSTVGQSDSVAMRGWVADQTDGAPLSNVTVYIDGTSVGAPTLGIARKDVAAAKGPAYLDSGFQLSYSAAALSLGSHAVTAIAIDSGGRSTTFGPVDITVAATAGPAPPTPPFGHIDLAVDSVTGSSTVGQSDSVAVKGWAADVIDGAPLSNVTVYIDGDILGTPTLGIARPDVAAAEGVAYLKSGYLMSFSAAGLALGSHAVTVTAIDSGGRSTTFGPVAFTVAAAAGAPPPFGHIDSAVDSVTGSSTVGQSDSVVVKGWVADAADGAPLSNITVSIDGTSVGTPTMGIARSDVSAAEGAAYLHSGYELNYSAAGLSIGSHTVTVTAIDSLGLSKTFGPLAFTVAATAGAAPPAPPFGHLDSAVDSVTGSTSVSAGGYVRIVGWVADAVDGAPVSNVTVYIDGSSVGQPAPGQARPDVAAALGAAYYNSGYRFAAPVVALDVGSHSVTVTAIDSGGRSTTFGPLEFTVLP